MSYYAGIDIGSLTCDAVIIDNIHCVRASEIVPTGARIQSAIDKALSSVLQKSGLQHTDLKAIISTGYGRDNVESRTRSVTEISCHALGAIHLFPKTRLVIDIGGQDTKVILIDGNGLVKEFLMNDKCAAGTGRFFEVMARALEIDLDDFGKLACGSNKHIPISNVCAVFAESEVISLVAQGETIENILAGLCWAVAERVKRLVQQIGVVEEITLTGGVAKNQGFRSAIEKMLGVKVNVPSEPQIVGALGAALIAKN